MMADYTPYGKPNLNGLQGVFLTHVYNGLTEEEAADAVGEDLAVIERSFADNDLVLSDCVRQARAEARSAALFNLHSGKSSYAPPAKEWFAQVNTGISGIEYEDVDGED